MIKYEKYPKTKAGKTRTLTTPTIELYESNKKRHYNDTTHNYGNFLLIGFQNNERN